MIREGLLEAAGRRVDVAYAVHVYSADHPFGTWFGRPGTLMAAADEVHVVVRGEGGHGSAPDRAKDPVPVACEIVLAYQERGHPPVQRVGPRGADGGEDRGWDEGQHHPGRRLRRRDVADLLGREPGLAPATSSPGSPSTSPRPTG